MSGRRSRAIRRTMVMAMTAKPGAVGLAMITPHAVSAATTSVACNVPALTSAITAADMSGGTLSLAAGCTYDLMTEFAKSSGTGLPIITNTITIIGNGATITRDAAAPDFRIIQIQQPGDLTLQDLTISNGSAPTESGVLSIGGGIVNAQGNLTVVRSSISGNKVVATGSAISAKGGGIVSFGGNTTITDSTVSGNRVSLINSGNNSPFPPMAAGGGISIKGGTLKVRNSTVAQNQVAVAGASGTVVSASGGGISTRAGGELPSLSGSVTITGSTISGNTVSARLIVPTLNTPSAAHIAATGSATAAGGGVEQTNVPVVNTNAVQPTLDTTIINSTVANNSVTGGTVSDATGGALQMTSLKGDTLTVINDTVAGNSGGSIAQAGPGIATIINTILARTSGVNCVGAVPDGGHNISFPASDTSCANTFGNADPVLGPLQNNGGGTFTMALGSGSAAIDGALASRCQAPYPAGASGVDQTGKARPETSDDATCDIGAFEVTPAVVQPSPSPSAAAAAAAVSPKLPKAGAPGSQGADAGWLAIPAILGAGALLAAGRRRRMQPPV